MQDEIRELSKEEYEQLKAAAEARRRPTILERNAREIVNNQFLIGEEGLEIGGKAWAMRKKGMNLTRISKELSVPYNVIEQCLAEFETRVAMEAGRMMHHFLALDNERIEDMLESWLPLAQATPITIEKVRGGEVFREEDFDRPLKASYFVLHAIQLRLKMMLATLRPGSPQEAASANTNIMVWLQQVLPGTAKAVSGKEFLVLETAAEKNHEEDRAE
jgi:hypothetical protein